MLGVVVGIGRWANLARSTIAALHHCTGVRAVVLGDDVWHSNEFSKRYDYPGFLKLHVFDLFSEENVLLLDADAIPIRECDLSQFSDRHEVIAVVDRYIGEQSAEAGITPDEYFNAGMMMLNRKHHSEMLALARRFHDSGERYSLGEQPLLNKARKMLGIPLLRLDERYNHLRFYDDPDFDPNKTVIAHWTPHSHDLGHILAFCRTRPVLCRKNAAAVASEFIQTISPYPSGYEGRGIVICAGGTTYLACAWVLIRRLRDLGCSLPIQVWYRGDQERDTDWESLVAPYDVQCIDGYSVAEKNPHPCLGGWELKPYAILHSRFREVLFLDADNFPVCDPTFLFDCPEYRDKGAAFWPDLAITKTPPDSPAWSVFGVPYRDEYEVESGQLLIDKERGWRPLQLCNWYNERSHFFYRIVYGDKNTFRFAWHRLEQEYAMPSRAAKLVPLTFHQFDFDGNLLFQHRVQEKWSLFGNTRVKEFVDEDACFSYIEELRARWNPFSRVVPEESKVWRKDMEQIAGVVEIEHVGRLRREITLLPGGLVQGGHADRIAVWWLDADIVVLANTEGAVLFRLAPQADGSWFGNLAHDERRMVRLTRRG